MKIKPFGVPAIVALAMTIAGCASMGTGSVKRGAGTPPMITSELEVTPNPASSTSHYTVRFSYSDPEDDVVGAVVTWMWNPGGNYTLSDISVMTKNGKAMILLRTTVPRNYNLFIQLKDKEGNLSNTKSAWVTVN